MLSNILSISVWSLAATVSGTFSHAEEVTQHIFSWPLGSLFLTRVSGQLPAPDVLPTHSVHPQAPTTLDTLGAALHTLLFLLDTWRHQLPFV